MYLCTVLPIKNARSNRYGDTYRTGAAAHRGQIVADGGRNAYRGLRYQYLRTLEALMAAVEEPALGISAVHIEGILRRDGADKDSVDYELSDVSGRVVEAVQVKKRAMKKTMGASEAFRALKRLVEDQEADRYKLQVGVRAGESVKGLAAALESVRDPDALRASIDAALASEDQRDVLAGMSGAHLARMTRARIEFDSRNDAEISESLRLRLRRYRERTRAGLGHESAGLLIDHLFGEISRRGEQETGAATVAISDFRSWVCVEGVILQQVLGRRDWGLVIGTSPPVPDVRRGEILDRMHQMLPLVGEMVAKCVLRGMSGIGKTSLAVGYVLDRADVYDVIFWADAESDQTLARSFSGIYHYLHGAEVSGSADLSALRDTVLTDLSSAGGRWLLVLDNCPDLRLADQWLPRAGVGHVVVTTTDARNPVRASERIDVPVMTPEQGVELIARRLGPGTSLDDSRQDKLLWLAKELDFWPLALEMAAAYLDTTGQGLNGIPGYIGLLKLDKLDDAGSVPVGYPRTLLQAIRLNIRRIREEAADRDHRTAQIAALALDILMVSAYLAPRQIPVYLAASVPEVDIDPLAMWRVPVPIVVDRPDCPPSEAVRVLRGQSLVAVDRELPPDTVNSAAYDSTIAINSVLQEVVRAQAERSSDAPRTVDLLAWHVQKWMCTALELGVHERALIMAAHAEAVEAHAGRMNLSSDFIEFLRGNLAVTLFRQNRKQDARLLLCAEIAHFQGRHDDTAELVICQACTQLAQVIADDGVAEAEEALRLLETAYLALVNSASHGPEGAAFQAAEIHNTLMHLRREYGELRQLAALTAKVEDLAKRLPVTELSQALRVGVEIAECMHEHHDCSRAIALARQLLDRDLAEADVQEALNIRRDARMHLIEALIAEDRPEEALTELGCFISETPPQMFAYEIKELVHASGYQCLVASVAGRRAAATLLSRLLADGRAELIESSCSPDIAARVRLLRGADAFNHGDLDLAKRLTDEFLADRSQREDGSARRDDWRKTARVLAGAIAAARDKAAGFARPAQMEGSGLGRLLQLAPGVQRRLITYPIELLPLYATLAAVSAQFDGPVGARSVWYCHQLHGCLAHLGFESEVIAAVAMVTPVEGETEYIGEQLRMPRLRADGSSDGHAVIWAESFGRLVDPTITETRLVREAAERSGISMLAAAPIANRDELFRAPGFRLQSQTGVAIELRLVPQWTQALTPAPGSELDIGLSYGQLALAQTVVEVMRGTAELRTDLPRLRNLYPLLADLIAGSTLLPQLPDEPPTVFRRLRRSRD
jgi:hypothetical protein